MRSRTMTVNEKLFLIRLVHKSKDVIESKKSDFNTLLEKKKRWMEITKEYNSSIPESSVRTMEQLRKCWENLKARQRQTEKKLFQNSLQSTETADPLGDFGFNYSNLEYNPADSEQMSTEEPEEAKLYTVLDKECMRSKTMAVNEKLFLIRLINKSKDIIESKKSDCSSLNARRKKWLEITKEFNSSLPKNSARTMGQLKKCWENLKAKQKMNEKKTMLQNSSQSSMDIHSNDFTSNDVEFNSVECESFSSEGKEETNVYDDEMLEKKASISNKINEIRLIPEIEHTLEQTLVTGIETDQSIFSSKDDVCPSLKEEVVKKIEELNAYKKFEDDFYELKKEEQVLKNKEQSLKVKCQELQLKILKEQLKQECIKTRKLKKS